MTDDNMNVTLENCVVNGHPSTSSGVEYPSISESSPGHNTAANDASSNQASLQITNQQLSLTDTYATTVARTLRHIQESNFNEVDRADFQNVTAVSRTSQNRIARDMKQVGKAVFEIVNGHIIRDCSKDFSLAHSVGEDMLMNSSVGVCFRKQFNNVGVLIEQQVKMGGVAILNDSNRFIYYLVTKVSSTDALIANNLRESLNRMKTHIVKNNVKALALPEIGHGIEQLHFSKVQQVLEETFCNVDIHIQIYRHTPIHVGYIFNRQGRNDNRALSDASSSRRNWSSMPDISLWQVGRATFQYVHGHLFDAKKEFSFAYTFSEDLSMDSGVSVCFRKTFKNIGLLMDQQVKTGGVAVLTLPPRHIYYLIAKELGDTPFTIENLQASLRKMKDHILANGVKFLALPEVNRRLETVSQEQVEQCLEDTFQDVDILINIFHYIGGGGWRLDGNIKVIHEGIDLVDIEDDTAIIYIASLDGHVTDTMRRLNVKHNFLGRYAGEHRQLGGVIRTEGVYDVLYGFVCVNEQGIFSYEMFDKCIKQFSNLITGDDYIYVCMSTIRSNSDSQIMEKIENIVKYSVQYPHMIEFWVCTPISYQPETYNVVNQPFIDNN